MQLRFGDICLTGSVNEIVALLGHKRVRKVFTMMRHASRKEFESKQGPNKYVIPQRRTSKMAPTSKKVQTGSVDDKPRANDAGSKLAVAVECTICAAPFPSKSSRKRHFNEAHKGESTKTPAPTKVDRIQVGSSKKSVISPMFKMVGSEPNSVKSILNTGAVPDYNLRSSPKGKSPAITTATDTATPRPMTYRHPVNRSADIANIGVTPDWLVQDKTGNNLLCRFCLEIVPDWRQHSCDETKVSVTTREFPVSRINRQGAELAEKLGSLGFTSATRWRGCRSWGGLLIDAFGICGVACLISGVLTLGDFP